MNESKEQIELIRRQAAALNRNMLEARLTGWRARHKRVMKTAAAARARNKEGK